MPARSAIVALTLATMLACGGCPFDPGIWGDASSRVQIRLENTSATEYVAPNVGVCPNGMAQPPHYFLEPPPVLGPGQSFTFTTTQLAGFDGNCATFATDFMIGLCGWQYGPAAADLAATTQRFGGQIGFQFRCGDTVILRWTDAGAAEGTWSSEVVSGPGNEPPTADFQSL